MEQLQYNLINFKLFNSKYYKIQSMLNALALNIRFCKLGNVADQKYGSFVIWDYITLFLLLKVE